MGVFDSGREAPTIKHPNKPAKTLSFRRSEVPHVRIAVRLRNRKHLLKPGTGLGIVGYARLSNDLYNPVWVEGFPQPILGCPTLIP